MATGDKLVTLDGLTVVYDKVDGDVGGLKSAVNTYFETSPNLIDPSAITPLTVISSSGAANSSTDKDTSDYIPVKPNTYYAWKNLNYVCRYGANKDWLGRTAATSQTNIYTSATCYYVRVCGPTGAANNWRFNEGSTVVDKPFVDGALLTDKVILTNQLDAVNGQIDTINGTLNTLVPTYGVPYTPPLPYHYTGEPIVPYKTSGHLQDVYDLYDALVTQYPQYVTKTVLGKDASNTYDICAYIINNGTNYAYRLPRFVWVSNVHGNEGNSMMATYVMAKEILDHFASDPNCYTILSAYTLYIIPTINPWGVENYVRCNSNNVNLNRNFPADWIYRDPSLPYGETKYGILSASNGSNAYYYYGGGTVTYDDTT